MLTSPKVKYTGSTPGANSSDYTLFYTRNFTPSASRGGIDLLGIKRVTLVLLNSHSGTLKAYFREANDDTDRLYFSQSVAAWSSGSIANNDWDFSVEKFDDWKLIWTNGGSAQTTWVVQMKMVCGERAVAT